MKGVEQEGTFPVQVKIGVKSRSEVKSRSKSKIERKIGNNSKSQRRKKMVATKHPSFVEFAKGTVISEADVEITKACFAMFDYQGTRQATPALVLTYKTSGGDVHEQGYTVGSMDDYAPSKDGKTLDILSDREKIHEQSNFAHFMEAFFRVGFPKVRMNNDDIGCIVGTQGHVKQEVIKRTGTNIKAETNLLVFDKITALPGEGTSTGTSAGASSDSTAEAVQIMIEILSETGTVERKKLLPLVIKSDLYRKLDKDTKTTVLNTIKSDEFVLNSPDWTVDKVGVVSLGGS